MDTGSRRPMVISSLWLQFAILTFIVGFCVLGYLAYAIYAQHPPIPDRVVSQDNRVLFTGTDVMEGQHLFQKYGLMQFGTIFGHGAYLGPDFTAQYLHQAALLMQKHYAGAGKVTPDIEARVRAEWKTNTYDPIGKTLVMTSGQAEAVRAMEDFYRTWFSRGGEQRGLRRPEIRDPDEIHDLNAYFAWAAWVAAAARPGHDYSYTNNWPPEPLVGEWPHRSGLPLECSEPDRAPGRHWRGSLPRRQIRFARLASDRGARIPTRPISARRKQSG